MEQLESFLKALEPWIPFFQSLLWPALLLVLALVCKEPAKKLFEIVSQRISEGSGAEAQAGPVKIALTQRAAVMENKPPTATDVPSTKPAVPANYPQPLYLVHAYRRDPGTSENGRRYYRLRLYLDADDDQELSKVERVVYHLHPTFQKPVQERTDPNTRFQVETAGWGEFNFWAEVYLKDQKSPIILERYLNLTQHF